MTSAATRAHALSLGAGVLVAGLLVGACGGPSGQPATSSTSATTTTSTPATTTSTPATTTTTPATTTTSGALQPVTGVRVYFLDSEHARTGEEPLFVPVTRQVRPPALAAGALDALFAGPTPAERDEGLRLVLSGATGYTGLHIEDGIARVRLEGGCSSGGSTMTIAGEIFPTLKQFSSVDYVKLYAPDGTTERPDGPSDSIPTCLEP